MIFVQNVWIRMNILYQLLFTQVCYSVVILSEYCISFFWFIYCVIVHDYLHFQHNMIWNPLGIKSYFCQFYHKRTSNVWICCTNNLLHEKVKIILDCISINNVSSLTSIVVVWIPNFKGRMECSYHQWLQHFLNALDTE